MPHYRWEAVLTARCDSIVCDTLEMTRMRVLIMIFPSRTPPSSETVYVAMRHTVIRQRRYASREEITPAIAEAARR